MQKLETHTNENGVDNGDGKGTVADVESSDYTGDSFDKFLSNEESDLIKEEGTDSEKRN